MSHSLVPIYIKPHLIPWLISYFPTSKKGITKNDIDVYKLCMNTAMGKMIRMLVQKTHKKPMYDKTSDIFFRVTNTIDGRSICRDILKVSDGESSFLELPEYAVDLFNEHLEDQLKLAMFYFIHAWKIKKGEGGLRVAVETFLTKYKLEEQGYTINGVTRAYYRKLNAGYFDV